MPQKACGVLAGWSELRSPKGEGELSKATSIATKTITALPQTFFSLPAEFLAPELIGCLLVKRQEGGELLWA